MSTAAETPPASTEATPSVTDKGKTSLGSVASIKTRLNEHLDQAKAKTQPKDEPQAGEKPKLPIEKKTEEQPAPSEPKVGTDGMTADQRAAFLKNKKSAEDATSRIKELEDSVKEGEASKKERDELKALLQKRDEDWRGIEEDYKKGQVALAVFNIQSTTKYKDQITNPINTHVDGVSKICKALKLPEDVIFDAIDNPDYISGNKALSEVITEMDDVTRGTFIQRVAELRSLKEKAEAMHRNAVTDWTELQKREKEEAESKKVRERSEYSAASDEVMEIMKSRHGDVLNAPVDGSGKTVADKIREQLASGPSFDELPPDHKAYYMQSGLVLLQYEAHVAKLNKELEQQKRTIESLTKKPGPGKATIPLIETDDGKKAIEGQTSKDRFMNAFHR